MSLTQRPPVTQHELAQAASQVHYALLKNPSPHCPNIATWAPWLEFAIGEVRRAFYEGRLRFKSVPSRALYACYEMERGFHDSSYVPCLWDIRQFSSNAEAAEAYGFDFGLEANDQGDVPVLEWKDIEKKSWIECITPRTTVASSSKAAVASSSKAAVASSSKAAVASSSKAAVASSSKAAVASSSKAAVASSSKAAVTSSSTVIPPADRLSKPPADRLSKPPAESRSAISARKALTGDESMDAEDIIVDPEPPCEKQARPTSDRSSEPTPQKRRRRKTKKRKHREAPANTSEESTNGASSPEMSDVDQRQTRSKASATGKGSLGTAGEASDDPAKRSNTSEPYVPPEDFFPPFNPPPGFYPCARAPRPTDKDPYDWRCRNCREADVDCIFFPVSGGNCHRCKGGSVGCDLSKFSPSKKGFAPGYGAYKAAVQWANPHIYPNPIPVSTVWAMIGNTTLVPTWFKEWWREHHKHSEEALAIKRQKVAANPDAYSLHRDDMEPVQNLPDEVYIRKNYPYNSRAPPPPISAENPDPQEDADGEGLVAAKPPAKKRRHAAGVAARPQPTPESLAPHNQAPPPPGRDFRNVPPTHVAPTDPVEELRSLAGIAPSNHADFVSRGDYNILLNRLEDQAARTRELELKVAEMRGQLDGILFSHGGGFQAAGSMFSRSPFAPSGAARPFSGIQQTLLNLGRAITFGLCAATAAVQVERGIAIDIRSVFIRIPKRGGRLEIFDRLQGRPTKGAEIDCPEALDVKIFEDCIHAVDSIEEAIHNKYSMEWTIAEHINVLPKGHGVVRDSEQARLQREFPVPAVTDCGIPHAIHSGAVIVDADQVPLVWALPDLLSAARHDDLFDATKKLKTFLDKPTMQTSSWRKFKGFFNSNADGGCGIFGIVPQMKDVFTGEVRESRDFYEAEVQGWLQTITRIGAILDAVLRILVPSQHKQVGEYLQANLPEGIPWPVTGIALQMIFNRKTPYHRDVNSFRHWYDLLVTLGNYGHGAYIGLRSLGYSVPYRPGTGVLVLANVVEHGVPEVEGTRIAISWYNRRDMVGIWGDEDDVVAPSETVQNLVMRILRETAVHSL
ncbi:uncharacterized protein BXZ73DRAFT_77997 [Epithele typhae]|uniref:uncharacterized protein n=1 Tax=Epithele typhae TaxID=378194 RepID=UPI0020082153|nr:uncharacterized protein BXZ73DRAFT_77997 [Epithele typhae]KAH9929880.1 hypothetical protein BXZ73DRAFT_77997 [Epithele typhae]